MSNATQSGGTGILSLLTVVFIVLKLTGDIDWSWFWVLSPTLIPLIMVGGGFLVVAIFVALKK